MAPDKFKGSLTAREAATAIARGIRVARPELGIVERPMADGGEGTVDAFVENGWTRIGRRVRGPLGEPVDAAFAWSETARGGPAAAIETAAASGLGLLARDRRDPLRASTVGTGELVRAALDLGARRILIALGGSATNDGGAGLLAALGVRFVGSDGAELAPGGAALADLARIDLDALDVRLRAATVEVAADVAAPLLGPVGASRAYGAQKGASAADIARLEAALERFADVAAATLGRDVRAEPGTGAAGGLGFALRAFLGIVPRAGVRVVAELCDLPAALGGAAWCYTGEGSIDAQTLAGKTVLGVAELAREAGVATTAFGGRVDPAVRRVLADRGIACVALSGAALSSAEAMRRAADVLASAAERAARALP